MRFLLRLLGWCLVVMLITTSVALPLYAFDYALPTPVKSWFFDRFFIVNLQEVPQLWAAVRDDPPLYELLRQRTRPAYLNSGWGHATEVARAVMGQHAAVYSDDAHLLAWARASLAVAIRLAADNPERCQRYLFGSYNQADLNVAPDAMDAEWRAFWNAVEIGARRQREGASWQLPSSELAFMWWVWTVQGPDPLSIEELAALRDDRHAPAAVVCRAELRRQRNILLQPQADATHLLRVQLAWPREQGHADLN